MPAPSPLAQHHLLLLTLSYASPCTLTRCMAVSSAWYDAATTHLWAHISYRVNRFLTDPGVSPYLPVPAGNGMRTLRRAKRHAVRHVRIVEVRTHVCEEVGCERMTLHGSESEDEDGGKGVAQRLAERGEGAMTEGTTATRGPDISLTQMEIVASTPAYKPVLTALRLHLDEMLKARPIPFPCPFVAMVDTASIVLLPLRNFSNTRPLPLPDSPSSALRKLVLLVIPPIHGPGQHRLAATIPASVEEVVVCLWRRHAASRYDTFDDAWTEGMMRMGWGPDKIWGHWCNFIVAVGTDGPKRSAQGQQGKRRRFTFVGTGGYDPVWLDSVNTPRLRVGQVREPLATTYDDIQDRFEAGMRTTLADKVREQQARADDAGSTYDERTAEVDEWLGSVRFLSMEQYQAEGRWSGEFTADEALYHGCS
jgi:hypothetical protein